MFLYITGVSGVGKTTLCDHLEKTQPLDRPIVSLGGTRKLMEFLGMSDLATFKRLLPARQHDWHNAYYQYHFDREAKDPTPLRIIDRHFHSSAGDLSWSAPIFPFQIDHQRTLAIIRLQLPVLVILRRRMSDQSNRPDRRCYPQEIEEEARAEEKASIAGAATLGCPIYQHCPYLQEASSAYIKRITSLRIHHLYDLVNAA